MSILEQCLADLEARIDESVEAGLERRWVDFIMLRCPEPVFRPRRPAPNPPRVEWPDVRINETLDDYERMALHQFRACSDALTVADGQPLNIRANYGTAILPMVFGAELFIMPDETNTLPASHPLPGGADDVQRLVDRGVPSLDSPYIRKVFEMGRRFVEIRQRYPKIGRWVHIYHPDLQGPMDVLEMLWGSDYFIELIDRPDLVHAFLDLITRTYEAVMRRWLEIAPPDREGWSTHWNLALRGTLMLRNDSAMNLPPDAFAEFIVPYDQRLLDAFGGGAMHACGRVDHFIELASAMRGLYGFNMSQPHLNDVEKVFRNTIDKGIVLLDQPADAMERALRAGRDLKGRVHIR